MAALRKQTDSQQFKGTGRSQLILGNIRADGIVCSHWTNRFSTLAPTFVLRYDVLAAATIANGEVLIAGEGRDKDRYARQSVYDERGGAGSRTAGGSASSSARCPAASRRCRATNVTFGDNDSRML
jgi:hypothetical protein